MTVFSYPSELVDPYPDTDSWFNGGIARATSDIAVAAWITERNDVNATPMHLAAVRYTDAGPEIGPTYTFETPVQNTVYNVVEGQDTEVWVVAADSNTPGIRLGVADVNIDTLELTLTWRAVVPSYYNAGDGGVLATSWPQQNLIILATNEGDPAQTNLDAPWVRLVDMTSGAVVQSVQTPRYDPDSTTSTSRVYAESIALHKDSGRLLISGDWYQRSVGYYRPGFWSITIDNTGFLSDWTHIVDIQPPSPTYSYFNTRWTATAGTADGWSVLFMGTYYWNTIQWFHLALDGTLTPGPTLSNASSYNNNNLPRVYDCAYDAAYDRSVACFMDWGNWDYNVDTNGIYIKGFTHLEAHGPSITALASLPKSDTANYVSMVNLAVVGPGRYVYLCASTGILRPRGPDTYDSFGPVTYVGGEAVDVSFRLGGQADETERAFRTVRTT
jgi:hypothetical protein